MEPSLESKMAAAEHLEKLEEQISLTPTDEKKLIRRLDIRLVGTCGTLLCFSLMDRSNLSQAAVAGLVADLKLAIGYRYSLIALIFFISYIIFQYPSMAVLRKVGPRRFLAAVTLGWGLVSLGSGFVTDWTQLLGLRFLLGFFESTSYPASIYLISTWYTRYELQKRYAVLYMIGTAASGCSGILAFGMAQLAGRGGRNGWSWIYILEGVITCIFGIASYWLLVDFPEMAHKSWNFISSNDQQHLIARVQADRGNEELEPFSLKRFFQPALDIKIWGFALLNVFAAALSYAIAYFLPIILNQGLGFSAGASQCLIAPPYVVAAFFMFLTAMIGDKFHVRGPLIIFHSLVMVIGLCLLGFLKNSGVRYFGVFLLVIGSGCNVPTLLAYQANNIAGQWKRAFGSATLISGGGIGGITGSLIFRSQDAPAYIPGLIGCLVCCGLNIVVVTLMSLNFRRLNRAQAQGAVNEGIPGFRYTY